MKWIVLLLLGAPAFGLNAMFLGMGGRVPLLYQRRRKLMLITCVGCGLVSTIPSISAGLLGWGSLEACLLLGFSIVGVGAALSLLSKRMGGGYQPPIPEVGELEELVKKFRSGEERGARPREA